LIRRGARVEDRRMGSKTVRFDEFDTRVQQYWLPSDFDLATVSGEVAEIAAGWNGQGFVRLDFDDATQVLTQVNHRLENGAYQEVWATGEDPATALARAQRADNRPASWEEMWQTYKGWTEFCQYAAEQQFAETTDFCNAVAAYRQAPSLQAQLELYARFVMPGSPEQVTLDNAALVEEIENRTDGGADVFDGAETEAVGMLRGRFNGFLVWYDNQV
jgi:hypothetical protein